MTGVVVDTSCIACNLVLLVISPQLSLKCLAFDALITPDNGSGLSRLQSACIEGDVETFSAIQENSPSKLDSVIAVNVKVKSSSLHFPGKSLWTVLMLHKSSRHKQILKLVETICSEFRSQSLIHVTAKEGKVHHLRRLLDCGEQLTTVENHWSGKGPLPLMLAAKYNDEEVFEFLIERGSSPEWLDDQQRTSIHYAAEGGKVRNLLRLIERGVNFLQKDRNGYSALHLAALNGHTDCVRLLIENGADVNELTRSYGFPRNPFFDDDSCPFDNTPLMLAAEKGHLQALHVLLQNGGELEKGNEIAWLPLHSAAKGGHTEVVKFLLEHDGNVLAETVRGTTVLHLASCLELVMILVEHGANVQASDMYGRTPLHVAAEKGQTDSVNHLLDLGADINARDKDGLLALHCALKGGHVTTAKFLIDKGSETLLSSDPNLLGFYEADLLQSSAREGLRATVEFLLSSGVSANAIHSKTDSLLTPLEEAACAGHCDLVRYLLDHGADINGNVASREERLRKRQMDSNSWEDRHYWGNICPLYAALRAGQGEVAKLLIEGGANVSPLNSGTFRALSNLAAKYGLVDVLKLLDHDKLGVIEDFRLKSGDTILTSAVCRIDFELVSHLLRNGLDVNTKNEDGNSSLHLLLQKHKQTSMEMFKLLLSFGADINALNNRFESPLLCAIDCEEEKIISLLLELDCAVNTEVPLGESPLSLAVMKGQRKLTEALLQCGADINQKCGRDEHTALHAAVRSFNRNGLAQLLVQHGADVEAEDVLGETPLFKAADTNNNELVEFFLKCGSTANTKNKCGETPLMKAIDDCVVSNVKPLLEHGASVNATDQHGIFRLLHRLRSSDVEICELLLEYGCDGNIADDNGETPLHQLAWGPDIMKMLLDKGAHVGALDRENRTPLHAASYQGHPSSIELLIHHGADINSTDNHGWTPLHFAAAGENYDALEVLIQNGSGIEAVDKTGRTALHLAAGIGCLSSVKLLIGHGSNINLKDYRGRTLLGATFKLDYSFDFYYLDFVKYYIEHGGDKFAIDDETGRSILHFAAGHQFVSTVDDLLDHGLDLEARDKNGETPLHRAVASGTEEMIQHLVNRGADVCAVTKRGQTPLDVSLVHHRSNFLLRLKPDLQKSDIYGNTPLHLAIYNPRISSMFNDPTAFSVDDVRILLNAGADIHSRDKQGNTPLHIAVAEDGYEIAELLIKKGSGVNARNLQGRTCLHMASCSGAQDIVQMLVAHGAEVNVEDERGCTPLHNALSFHHYWLVEPLLKHGSNPNAVDYKGSTPLHAGCSYNDAYDFLYPDPADTEPSWYSAFQDEWVSIMISHGR